MRAVWLVLVAGFRRQWRSWVLLGLLVAVASGFVLASTAAGHRTDAAFPRYVASHGYDAIVYTIKDLPELGQDPEVAQVTPVRMPFYDKPGCSCHRQIYTGAFSVREVPPASLGRVAKLVAGRMPDPSSPVEALASFTLERDYGVHLGTVITLPMAGASQRQAVFNAMNGQGPPPKPTGPRMAMRVVGIVAAENEFSSGQGTTYDLYPGPAFAVATKGSPALTTYYVRLRHGQAGLPRFEARTSRVEGTGVQDLDRPEATIMTSIHPQAVGWRVLAALAALAGIAVVGQALARQASAEGADHSVLAALGLSPRQFAARIMLRTLVVAVAGAAGGIAVATLLSPLAPLGEARLAEPAPGLSFDAPVLSLGALATVAVVMALGVLPALRAARMRTAAGRAAATRPSAVAGAAAAAGAPPGAVIGIQHALERGRGTRAVPVGTALIGSVAGVAALCATAVFGSSLAHLTSTPALYGAPFQDIFLGGGPGDAGQNPVITELEADRAIRRITLVMVAPITVNRVDVTAVAAAAVPGRGPMLLSAAEGRLPAGEGQIALGASTMRTAGARIGSVVRVTATDADGAVHAGRFRVVGLIPLPTDFGTGGIGTGAALTTASYIGLVCPPSPRQAQCRATVEHAGQLVLVRAAPGPAGAAALARHIAGHRDNASPPTEPAALVNFGASAAFPLLLGGVVAFCGLAALAHLLVVSVTRRRTETGLLRALGMTRRQLATIVFWQATTVAVIAIAAGIPLGIAAGRAIWRAFAISLGVVPVPVVQAWLIVALAAGALLAANALAAIPAMSAARSRSGQLLRTE
ncbi:MAG TPA: ABC transporter permease [Streptosporangiaceae bacterium]|nr:ABC transporter permease [Streptosporangiaceae bacterium]